MPAVSDVLLQQQLQLRLVAGRSGLWRELEWAHSCDLVDPWTWVGDRQALLTNGSSIPIGASDQVEWAEQLSAVGVVAVAIGDEMEAPYLHKAFFERCDSLGLPCFFIPYPLSFSAVAQAVATAASAAQAQRLRIIGELYDLSTRDLGPAEDVIALINAVEGLLGHDIVIIDASCGHDWIGGSAVPGWLQGVTNRLEKNLRVPQIFESPSEDFAHAVPLAAMPGAVACFYSRNGTPSNQYLFLHAAAVLGAALSRAALDELQGNRRHVEYLDKILYEQMSLGSGSDLWMRGLGITGEARGLVFTQGGRDERETTIRRLKRHGVKLAWTLQGERQLAVAQHPDLMALLEHSREVEICIGVGTARQPAEILASLREAVWALESTATQPGVVEFDETGSWFGFHDPASAAQFVNSTLGPLLESAPHREELLVTLKTFLRLDRSLVQTSKELMVHRQTVVQRLSRIEHLLGVSISSTESIARLWLGVTLHNARL